MWILATIILIVLAVFLLLYGIFKNDNAFGAACIISPILFLTAVGVYKSNTCVYTIKPTPSALDVYRGNTELRITSVNGVPTDTIVVFKKK